jgi:hypothetical protein
MAQVLLFVFTCFLITPTIMTVIEKNNDMSVFFGSADNEKADLEMEAVFTSDFEYLTNDFTFLNSSLILSKNLSIQFIIASKIFIPPPQQA